MSGKVKIIGGEWRGRHLSVLELKGLRPTPSRVRETLFNWLQYDIVASRCLDLYAGSGALGVEAASRGAKHVVQIDSNQSICRQLQANNTELKADNIKVVCSDVLRYLSGDTVEFDVIFLDPPFFKGLAVQTLQWLEEKPWLAEGAKIYIEVEKSLLLNDYSANWQCLKHKTAGQLSYYLFEWG